MKQLYTCITPEVNLRNPLYESKKHVSEGYSLSLKQIRHHLKAKNGVSVTPQKNWCPPKIYKNDVCLLNAIKREAVTAMKGPIQLNFVINVKGQISFIEVNMWATFFSWIGLMFGRSLFTGQNNKIISFLFVKFKLVLISKLIKRKKTMIGIKEGTENVTRGRQKNLACRKHLAKSVHQEWGLQI